jgi:AraC-like DNA-binding protein
MDGILEEKFKVKGKIYHPDTAINLFLDDGTSIEQLNGIFRAVLFLKGSASMIVNGQRVQIVAPSILCLNGEERIVEEHSEGLSIKTVYFRQSVVNALMTREIALSRGEDRKTSVFVPDLFWLDLFVHSDATQRVVNLSPRAFERALGLIKSLGDALYGQSDMYWPCRSRSFFLEFLFYIRTVDGESIHDIPVLRETPDSAKVSEILIHLHTYFAEDVSLGDICDRFAINRTSLNEIFRRNVGQTPIQYLISIRIKFARLLLRDTMLPIKEIAWRSGFRDIVNFNRTFRKVSSRTPLQYRNHEIARSDKQSCLKEKINDAR